ncbi:unnamed protein product, partial [Leptidea sinapis]
MLSPKIQRSVRVNDGQLIALSERAQYDHSQAGYLHKRSADNAKWQLRWFILYQNLLFYYESENNTRPTGVLLLEGSYCERLSKAPMERNASFCFTISYRRESQRQYELRAASEVDCAHWVDAIREASVRDLFRNMLGRGDPACEGMSSTSKPRRLPSSQPRPVQVMSTGLGGPNAIVLRSFNKLLLQKEELEQKQLHLLQVVESERTSRWQYAQQCDELSNELKKLRSELCAYKKEHEPSTRATSTTSLSPTLSDDVDPSELRKIKKVQSFFRGWLCRRRWKQIVDQYIKSPHAESMRKRNSLVFKMVEAEEEYLEQMEILENWFNKGGKQPGTRFLEQRTQLKKRPLEVLHQNTKIWGLLKEGNTQDSDILMQQVFSNTQHSEQIDRGVDSASSQKPWLEKRKRRAPKTNPESSPFEKELLTLSSNQTPDLAADDLAFFASLGPILKSFYVGQKLEFRSRVLREAMDIRNYNRSNSSYSIEARRYASSYNYQSPPYPEYETNNANSGYSGYLRETY